MSVSPYSLTPVTCVLSLQLLPPTAPNVLAFGEVVVTALYPNGLTIWVMTNGALMINFNAYCMFLVVMAACLHAELPGLVVAPPMCDYCQYADSLTHFKSSTSLQIL